MTNAELIELLREAPPDGEVKLRVGHEGDDFVRFRQTHAVFVAGRFVCSWKVSCDGLLAEDEEVRRVAGNAK